MSLGARASRLEGAIKGRWRININQIYYLINRISRETPEHSKNRNHRLLQKQ